MNETQGDTVDEALVRFLRESGGFVSGSELADRLGMSRVAVRGRLEKLKKEGFGIQAIRNKGYRLTKTPSFLNETLLRGMMRGLPQQPGLVFRREVDSTNRLAESLLTDGRQDPFVVLALAQTAGKGRLGRKWESDSRDNAYLSFAFRPNLPPSFLSAFTLWMGVSICQLLNDEFGCPVLLKWPNDILFEGKKLAGMLTESRTDSDLTREIIFGIGLNINADSPCLPPGLRDTATSLKMVRNRPLDMNETVFKLVACALNAYETYLSGQYRRTFRQLWIDYDCLNGRPVTARTYEGMIEGTGAGIDESGALRLVTADGRKVSLHAGDVTLKRSSPPPETVS